MQNVKNLLDAVKHAAGVESDYALAKFLDVRTQRISDYYKGNRAPDNFVCLKIAEVLKKPLAEVIAAVELDAEKDEKRLSAWEKYYKRVGGLAASLFLAVLLSVTFKVTPVEAAPLQAIEQDHMQFVLCKVYISFARFAPGVLQCCSRNCGVSTEMTSDRGIIS